MELLQLPAPLFGWIDGLLTVAPASVRLMVWGAAAGIFSMSLYRTLSPQAHIARSKREQAELRDRLDAFDGELVEAWPLIRRLLGLSMAQVGRVAAPAVAASVPVLMLLVWLSGSYGQVEYLPVGPRWLRGWELPFFTTLLVSSLVLKRTLRIH